MGTLHTFSPAVPPSGGSGICQPDFAGVDWARVTLPPCLPAVIDRIEASARHADRRHAELVRAYYAAQVTRADGDRALGRVRRVAAGQIVVVAGDGTVLATWRDRPDTYGTACVTDREAGRGFRLRNAPETYDALMTLLEREGTPVSRHRWGDHRRVHTPHGRHVFVPAQQVPGDDVAADAELLHRFGALVCLSQDKAVG